MPARGVSDIAAGHQYDQLRRHPLTSAETAAIIFEKALPDDFYPILVERDGVDETGCKNFRAIRHKDRSEHDDVINSAAGRKTYWNLLSYRASGLGSRGHFSFKKTAARAVHGVFVDLDCGRKEGDEGWEKPGRLLTQTEVSTGVTAFIEQQILPPFQLWADGTRGCYGVLLFDAPHQNVEEAAEMWRDVRGYFYRRAKCLAADEGARAITQPLKASGACGVVRYYLTEAKRTSLAELLVWFQNHPHPTDLVDYASPSRPWTVELDERMTRAHERYESVTPMRTTTPRPRSMTWTQKAAPMKARIDDFKRYVHEFRKPGYSRRQFFLDFASAVKSYEFQRDGDPERVYRAVLQASEEINAMFDRPLSAARLQEQVYSANPNVHRSTNNIRLDMGITEALAERLGLRTLIPAELRVERIVRKREEMAERAVIRLSKRKERAEQKAKEKEDRRAERQRRKEQRASSSGVSTGKNEERDDEVVRMLRDAAPTSEIESALGVHRQQIVRIRKRIVASGEELPQQRVLKRGRRRVSP